MADTTSGKPVPDLRAVSDQIWSAAQEATSRSLSKDVVRRFGDVLQEDSLSAVWFCIAIEERFKVKLEVEEIAGRSFDDVVHNVWAKLQKGRK